MGLSPTAYNFIGGLKAHAKAYIALTAPTVTPTSASSIGAAQRLGLGSRSTSATAGTTAPRCCASPTRGRIEDRTVDGSCNPYLAATAVLAAGLDGIERGLDPGEPTTALNLHELTEDDRDGARRRRAAGEPAGRHPRARAGRRAAGGARHTAREDYIDYFVKVKQREWSEAHEQITQWELDRYLQLY